MAGVEHPRQHDLYVDDTLPTQLSAMFRVRNFWQLTLTQNRNCRASGTFEYDLASQAGQSKQENQHCCNGNSEGRAARVVWDKREYPGQTAMAR